MTELKLPRTDTELDALITATSSADIRRASRSLLLTLADEIDLRDDRRNQRGGYFLILEAVMDGIDPAELPAHFEREAAASRQRVQTALAALDEAGERIQARRAIVQAGDGKLAVLLAAIECAQDDSIRAVRRQETDVEHVKHSRLVEAATAVGIDPAELTKLRPPLIDKEAENLRRHWMGTAVAPIRAVLADPLRRLDPLPEWTRRILAEMGSPSGSCPAAQHVHLKSVVTLLNKAAGTANAGMQVLPETHQ